MKDNQKKYRVLFIREKEFTQGMELVNYGMAVVATVASREFEVKAIDNNSKYFTFSILDIIKAISEFGADVVCFSIATINALSSYATIKQVKKQFPDLPIIAGGLHVSHLYIEGINNGIDYVVRGEADLAINPLLHAIISGSNTLIETMEGVYFSDANEGRIKGHGISPLPINIDDSSIVDCSLYDIEQYMENESDKNKISNVLLQRGCPFKVPDRGSVNPTPLGGRDKLRRHCRVKPQVRKLYVFGL